MMQLSVSVTESANDNHQNQPTKINQSCGYSLIDRLSSDPLAISSTGRTHVLAASGDGKLSPELVSIVHAKRLLYTTNSTVNTERSVTGVRMKTSLDH